MSWIYRRCMWFLPIDHKWPYCITGDRCVLLNRLSGTVFRVGLPSRLCVLFLPDVCVYFDVCCTICLFCFISIRLEARLQPNIRNTLRPAVLTMFTRSRITPQIVNWFGWNLEHSEHTVWGWPRQILSAIRAVGRAEQPGEILLFCQINNARIYHFPSAKCYEIWARHVHRCRDEPFGTEFW